MPANLTPDYKAAEAAYRKARDPAERLQQLREMLRLIPKHKGTDHLQADIKSKIKELTDELAGPRKGAARTGPPTVIRPDGAAQVALLGPPNTGKSAIHSRLTGSHTSSEPYPFTTQYPQPGMLQVEDAQIQLVDLPSLSADHPVPWIANALQPSDAALLVVDLTAAGCVEQVEIAREMLEQRRVYLVATWPKDGSSPVSGEDPFALHLPAALVVNKTDLLEQAAAEIEVFRELTGIDFPALAVSAETGEGLDAVGPWLFDGLGVVRVYTKIPGKPPDLDRPFTVRSGDTVADVAELVHRDIAASLRYARLWGRGSFEGQQVGRDHQVADGDVLELHT